jgi:hypothetical protein
MFKMPLAEGKDVWFLQSLQNVGRKSPNFFVLDSEEKFDFKHQIIKFKKLKRGS